MARDKSFGIDKFKGLLLAGSFAMVVEFLMGLTDSIVAGHLLGESALAAINLLSPVLTGVTFFAGLCGVGMGVNYALANGRGETARAHQFFTQALWTVLAGGVALVALLAALRGPFLAFMDPGAAVAEPARVYWLYYLPSALLEPAVVLLVNAAMADGDSRLCFTSYVVQLFVNLVVSLAAVRALGAGGCALGTTVANLVALGILACHFRRRSNSFRLVRHFALRDTLRIWQSSIGDSSSFFCSAALFFFLNKYVIAHFGPGLLPVLSCVIVTIGFLEIFNGVGTALAPIVTVYVGERNTRAVRMMMRVACRLAVAEGLALTAVLFICPQVVTVLVGIGDPALRAGAHTAVRFVSAGFVFYALAYLFNSYYVFIAHEGLAVALTVLNGLAMPVALVALFGRLGPNAVWASLAVAPLVAMSALAAYLVARHGRARFPLLLDRARDAKLAIRSFTLDVTSINAASRETARILQAAGVDARKTMRAALMVEEVFMAVRDRNAARRRPVLGEVTIDLNEGVALTLRDDGEIFDITDADQQISSLRTFLVASVMERQKFRRNILTTGFNRNLFKF